MMKSDPRNRPFIWATHFLRELYNTGVDHLIVSPGSRSTPLVMAASAHAGFQKHMVLDERSAAFIALGVGKATGVPAALICTSGTAAANYYPAVIEARQSGVPLLLLTADRPPNLRSTGASQAIDQLKLYGDTPVFFHEAGEPVLERQDLDRLRQLASQAVHLSKRGKGPAHINFPFRKPLEPNPGFVKDIEKENNELITDRTPSTAVHNGTGQPLILPTEIQNLIKESEKPVIITGPSGPQSTRHPAQELAGMLSAPHLREFGPGGETSIRGFNGFLRSATHRESLRPDLIVRFGQQPVSKALNLYLEEHRDLPHLHFGDLEEWHDASHSVTHRIEWFGREVNWQLETVGSRSTWLERWMKLDQEFNAFRERLLNSESALTDGHVFSTLGKQLGNAWEVVLSNSFPVRDMMLFGETTHGTAYVNRGASGIDGVLSTAIGTSLGSARGKGTALFIGDLALLHDSNGLLSSGLPDRPLVAVVLNNGGGTIFRMLPIYEQDDKVYTGYFETPQDGDFEHLARTYKIPFVRVESIEELEALDLDRFDTPGIHLVECRTDPDASMKLRETLWNFDPS